MKRVKSLLSTAGDWVLSGLFALVPNRIWEALCEYGSGHRYTTAVLHGEGSFVVDPTTRCLGCAKPMSENVYASVTSAYAQALITDEAWD